MEEIFIVYIVKNNLNNKVYIGQTTESLEKRWFRHTHYQLKRDDYFHNALRKYGPEHFFPEVLDDSATDQEKLNELEIAYILKYPKERLYNTKYSIGKCGGDTLSTHPNKKEICKKISISKIGGRNPHSRKIIAYNENNTISFNSLSECQDFFMKNKNFQLSRYIISRRIRGIVKIPITILDEKWNFKYQE